MNRLNLAALLALAGAGRGDLVVGEDRKLLPPGKWWPVWGREEEELGHVAGRPVTRVRYLFGRRPIEGHEVQFLAHDVAARFWAPTWLVAFRTEPDPQRIKDLVAKGTALTDLPEAVAVLTFRSSVGEVPRG